MKIKPVGIQPKEIDITEQMLTDMLSEARDNAARGYFMKRRKYFWQLYRGEIKIPEELDVRPKGADFTSKENKIFEGTETIVGYQTKNNPRYYCVAQNPSFEHLAAQMNGFLRYDYECYVGMRVILQEWVRGKCICGAQPVKNVWDVTKKEEFGEGVNRVDVVSWDDFFPYPYCQDIQSMPYIIHRIRKPYLDVINDRNYGEVAYEVLGKKGLLRRFSDKVQQVINVDDVTPEGRELIDIYEYWIRPYSMIEAETSNGKVKVSKYPGGIIITTIRGKPVWIRGNPYNHKRFPFIMMYCYRNRDTADREEIRGTFYDFMGEVEQAVSPQQDVDMMTNAIIANARVLASPPVVVNDSELSVPVTAHEMRAGEIYHARQDIDRAVKILSIPEIPVSAMNLAEQKKNAVFQSMGITDYMRGTQPTSLSHSSGFMLSLAQEAGFGRTHPKTNLLDQAMMELGNLLVLNNQQFRRRDTYLAFDDDGERQYWEWTEDHARTKMTIQVEHGSTTPANDLDRINNAVQLFQILLPIISLPQVPPHLLDWAAWLIRTTKIPGMQSALQIINQIKEEQATIQDLMALLQEQAGGVAEETTVTGISPEVVPPEVPETEASPSPAGEEGITEEETL